MELVQTQNRLFAFYECRAADAERTLSDKVVPVEKKNEIQSFVENFFCIDWCIAYPLMILLLWIFWEYTCIPVLR